MGRRSIPAMLGLASLACAEARPSYAFPWQESDRKKAYFLRYDSAAADRFSGPEGGSCGRLAARRFELIGWESDPNSSDPICSHDTLLDGVGTASLDLLFRGAVPADGDLEINTFDNGLRVFVTVQSRGSWVGDSVTNVRFAVEARSDHCSLSWMSPLASAATFGPERVGTPYGGYKEIPRLRLRQCKAGDALEVRVRLIADSNRGRVEVDSFAFRAGSAEEANRVVGLVPRRGEPPAAAASTCATWDGEFCAHPVIDERNAPVHGDTRSPVGPAVQPHR